MNTIIKKCPKCGASVKNDDLFCGVCSCKIEDSSVQADGNNSERYLSAKEATEQNKSKQIFIDSDEHIVQTLGNGYLQNIVSSSGVTKTTAVLTPKRLYFSGIGFEKDGRIWKKIRVSKIIDLEDITGTGFINVSQHTLSKTHSSQITVQESIIIANS